MHEAANRSKITRIKTEDEEKEGNALEHAPKGRRARREKKPSEDENREALRRQTTQLGETDSDARLDEFLLKNKEKADLTFAPYAIGLLILALLVADLPFPLPYLAVIGYVPIFYVLRRIVLSQIVKTRLEKYYNLVADVLYTQSGGKQIFWTQVVLKLSTPEEILPDSKLLELLKSSSTRASRSEAGQFAEIYERIRDGRVRSLFAETPDHKYHVLFVEYANGNDHPSPISAKTRFGRTSVNAFRKNLWYVGNYRLYDIPESNSIGDQVLVFSGRKDASPLRLVMPNLVETLFMIANLNRIRQEKSLALLKAKNESLRAAVEALEEHQKAIDAILSSSRKVSRVLDERLLTKIDTSPTRAELEVKPVGRFDMLVSLVKRSSKWFFLTIAGLIIVIVFGPYLSSLISHWLT